MGVSVPNDGSFKKGAGAPPGNKNAANAKEWKAAIKRALERRGKTPEGLKQIDVLADVLIDKALEGDMRALREFGDRMDGKSAQAVEVSGELDISRLVIKG